MSRPRYCELLTQCEASTRKINKLDKFTDAPASKVRTKDGSHFLFLVIGDPVPCHKPGRARLFAFHAGKHSSFPRRTSSALPRGLLTRPG
jgi:hypothetical protein